jgi:hypothetical protein
MTIVMAFLDKFQLQTTFRNAQLSAFAQVPILPFEVLPCFVDMSYRIGSKFSLRLT